MKSLLQPVHLLQFTVKNYRSIREPLTLSMIASSKQDSEDSFNAPISNQHLLRSAAILGANASGKSNLIRALFLMRNFTLVKMFGNKENVRAFALDGVSEQANTVFEISFELNSRLLVHGYEMNAKKKQIVREWLKFSDASHPRLTSIFERQGDDVRMNTNIPVSVHGISRSFRKQISPDMLFVTSVAKLSKNTLAHELIKAWDSCYVVNALTHDYLSLVAKVLYEEPALKTKLLPLLKQADFHISSIEVRKSEGGYKLLLGHRIKRPGSNTHEIVLFDVLKDESAGTKKFLSFAMHLVITLDEGSVLVLDELGSLLHPKLIHFIIDLFKDKKKNKNNAQLIISAHDTSILDRLSRDEIYFTHKNEQQATELYSLSDFKGVRKNTTKLAERYLRGDYGAIPEIDEG